MRRIPSAERMLIIGTSPLARKLIAEITACRGGVAAIVDDVSEPEAPFVDLLAGPLSRLGAIIREFRPDRIVIALADRRGRLPMRELLEARVHGVVVEDGVQF